MDNNKYYYLVESEDLPTGVEIYISYKSDESDAFEDWKAQFVSDEFTLSIAETVTFGRVETVVEKTREVGEFCEGENCHNSTLQELREDLQGYYCNSCYNKLIEKRMDETNEIFKSRQRVLELIGYGPEGKMMSDEDAEDFVTEKFEDIILQVVNLREINVTDDFEKCESLMNSNLELEVTQEIWLLGADILYAVKRDYEISDQVVKDFLLRKIKYYIENIQFGDRYNCPHCKLRYYHLTKCPNYVHQE